MLQMVPIAKGNMRTLDKDNNETITNLRNQTSNGSDMRSESGGMLEKPSNGEFSGEEAQVSRIPSCSFSNYFLCTFAANNIQCRLLSSASCK